MNKRLQVFSEDNGRKKSNVRVFMKNVPHSNEESLAIWLGNMRLAKYRHDNGLPPLIDLEEVWDFSIGQYALEHGMPDMFVASEKQIAVIKASNATKISYDN